MRRCSLVLFLVFSLAIPPISSMAAGDDKAAFDQAMAPFNQGDWAATSQSLHAFVLANPNSEYLDDALYYIAQAASNAGDKEANIRALKELSSRCPNSPIIEQFELFCVGLKCQEHLVRAEFAEARRGAEDFLTSHPATWRIYQVKLMLASTWEQEALQPQTSRTLTNAATCRQRARSLLDEAVQANTAYLARAGLTPQQRHAGLMDRFEILFEKQDFPAIVAGAQEYLNGHPAVDRDSLMAKTWLGVGKVCVSPGNYNEGAGILDSVLNTTSVAVPKNDDPFYSCMTHAYYWRIWMARELKDSPTARACLARVRSNMPESPKKAEILSRFRSLDATP